MAKKLRTFGAMTCLGIAVSLLGLSGCASRKESSSTASYTEADRQLARDVVDNLRRAPDAPFPNVAVSAHEGQVLLRGSVANEAQRAEAGQIASQVPGVSHVDNALAVTPANPAVGGATSPGGSTQ